MPKTQQKARKAGSTAKQGATPGFSRNPKRKESSSGWEWAPFTVKAVVFNRSADTLGEYVRATYGKEVSISHFEKFCLAASSFSEAERQISHLDATGVSLLASYQAARDARDAERSSFRSDVKVTDTKDAMASLLAEFSDGRKKRPIQAAYPSEGTPPEHGVDEEM